MITTKLGDSIFIPRDDPKIDTERDEKDDHIFNSQENDEDPPIDWIDSDPVDETGVAAFEHSLRDTLVNAEVLIPQCNKNKKCKVKGRHVDSDGQVTG